MMVQLHCKGPTANFSRINAGFAASMGVPVGLMAQFWHSAIDDGYDQEERPIPVACSNQAQRVAPTDPHIQYPGGG